MREQLKVLEQKSSVSKAHTLLEVVKAYKSTLECMTADGISRLVQMQLAFCSMEDKLAKMNAQTFLKKSNTSGSISKLRDIVPMSTINGIDEECKRFHDKGDATTLVPACVNIPFTEMHASALATGGVSGGQVVNSNQEAITDLVEDNFSERQTGDNEEKIVSVYSIKLAIAAKNLDLLDYNAPLNTYASYIVSHAESTSLSSLITSCIPAYNKGGLHRTDDKSTSYGNGNKFMESNSNDMTELDKNNGNPTYKRALTVPHLKLSKAKPHPVVNHTKKEKYDPFIYILIHQVDSAHLPSTASVRAMTGKGKYHMRMYSDDILSLSSNPPPSGCPIQSLVGVVREPIRLSKLLEMSVRRKSVTMKLINPLNRSLEKRLHARSACGRLYFVPDRLILQCMHDFLFAQYVQIFT